VCDGGFVNARRASLDLTRPQRVRVREVTSPPLFHFALLLSGMHVLVHLSEPL
jgi:hypothetical protein